MARFLQGKSKALHRQRQRLLQELAMLSHLLRGSIFERFSTCCRPNCACHKGRRHGPRTYIAVTQDKTQGQHYVPRKQEKAVRQGVAQYHRLQEIVGQITEINLQLMRGGVLEQEDSG